MDGRLLAQARKEKEDIRRRALQRDRQRHEEVYARVPRIRDLDGRIAALVPQAAAAALTGGADVDRLRREGLALQAQRAELLVENGWAPEYLDGAWDCPRCRDTGYVRGQMCSCLRALYEKAQARDLSALLKLGSESFAAFDLRYYDDRPDPASGVAPRVQMETVLGVCHDYALHFGRSRMDLLFRGGTGLGKTFLSACIAREVAGQGFSVVYETAVDALSAFERERWFSREEESAAARELVRRMMECDLLILDDLGMENLNDATRTALYTLVNGRLAAQKRTIISTNLSADQMARRYGPQLMSRLEGEYQVLAFAGTDIRLLKKERGLD